MKKFYIRLADGTTGVMDTSLTLNEVYKLYPADTRVQEEAFPEEVAAAPVEVEKPKAKKK